MLTTINEKKQRSATFNLLFNIRNRILAAVAESTVYTNWDDDFKLKMIMETTSPEAIVDRQLRFGNPKNKTELEAEFKINLEELTEEEALEIGFIRWSEESPMLLIPLWVYKFLPDDVELTSISGKIVSGKEKLDTDNRFGMLAYGFFPKAETVVVEPAATES